MHDFVFDLPVRVVFGAGAGSRLGEEVARLGAGRALICCTQGGAKRAEPLAAALGDKCAGIFADAQPHCPEPVAMAAVERFDAVGADCAIAFGGGSTIGLGKVIAVRTGRPTLAIPTTYSGSEMTSIYGMLIGKEKRTKVDAACRPKTVIYDPALTTSLSAHLTATSGMNGLAHCVEALYPRVPDPVAALMAEAGLRALDAGLRGSIARPDDLEARGEALYGAFLGGSVVGLAGIAIHHKTCHVLGGRHGIPHGESNAVILPHAAAYNAAAAPAAMAALRRALGGEDAAGAIYDLARTLGAPASLKELGMAEAELDEAARLTVKATAWNPRELDFESVRNMLDDAYFGRRPTP